MKSLWRAALFFGTIVSATAVAPAEMSMDMPEPLPGEAGPTIALPSTDELMRADVTGPDFIADEDSVDPALPEDLRGLVMHFADTQPADREMECLAGAIYFETRGESLEGQLAVGHVIANRAASSRFPDSYCGVVYQRSQFSFVRGGKMPPIKRGSLAWKRAVAIARIVDGEHHEPAFDDALFFHARYVNPRWRLTRLGAIDNHIFYR